MRSEDRLIYSFYYILLIEKNTYGFFILVNSGLQTLLYILFYEAYDKKDKWRLLKILLIMNLGMIIGLVISIYEMSLR